MLLQPRSDEIRDFAGNLRGQLPKASKNARSIENTARHQERRVTGQRAAFSVVYSMMRETPSGFPANCVFITVFSIRKLKCYGRTVITEPYEEILFMRKEPPASRFSRNLFDVGYLHKHFKDF